MARTSFQQSEHHGGGTSRGGDVQRRPALKVSRVHLCVILHQPRNQLSRCSTRLAVRRACVVKRRPKATAGHVGGGAPIEEQVDHLGSAEAAGLCQQGRMEPTTDRFYVTAFVEEALHLGEILPPYRPGCTRMGVRREAIM